MPAAVFTLTPIELEAWIAVGRTLLIAGLATVQSIRAFFRSQGLTDEELNRILQALSDDAAIREARSRAIAAGEPDPGLPA